MKKQVMNKPHPEHNPSNTSTQIAILCGILKTHDHLDEQEKTEAIKLKVEIERLIEGSGVVTEEALKGAIVGGGDPRLPKPRHITPIRWPRIR
jgi:hypothetical protein